MNLLLDMCVVQKITTVYFECHWLHREKITALKARFCERGISVKMKIGVETFDALFRESYLDKGMGDATPEEIAKYFNQVCLLQGLPGQNKESMLKDIALGLQHFEHVCVNIMVENTKPIKPDYGVIEIFKREVYPLYKDNEQVDILLNNTDFGVGV